MIEMLAEAAGRIDITSLGVGGAFVAGILVTLRYVQKLRQNGKHEESLITDLRFLMDRAEKRDERIVAGLNRITESQARMATLLEVLVQKTCQGGLAKGVPS